MEDTNRKISQKLDGMASQSRPDTKVLKKIPSSAPFFDDKDIEEILGEVRKILKSKRLVLGPYNKEFEDSFSRYIGTKYSVAVSSATAALEIVLRYIDIRDAEVIVPTNTFIACPNSVLAAGGKPVFGDVDPQSFCMDIEDVKRKIGSKTKAIMLVHLAGLPQPGIDELKEICSDNNIQLFEDASHAHGASYGSRKVGSVGMAGCFSLFATKILSTGTGGILTTDDEKLRNFAEALRHQGGIGGEGQIEVFDKYGYDWMMSEVTAAIGISQLNKLDRQLEQRRLIAESYRKHLRPIAGVKPLKPFDGLNSSHWKFIVVLDDKMDRNKVRATMRQKFMTDAGILYPTLCHLQPLYAELGYKPGLCPVGEEVMKHQLTLPINPYMTDDDVQIVCNSLAETINN
jgi:dTDP-4-amino-4,6-dideoxygalactose transaminase